MSRRHGNQFQTFVSITARGNNTGARAKCSRSRECQAVAKMSSRLCKFDNTERLLRDIRKGIKNVPFSDTQSLNISALGKLLIFVFADIAI